MTKQNMEKKKLYISLPISGHDIERVKKQATYYAGLWSRDFEVITPFDACYEENMPYSYYMGRDIEAILECDAIYMAPGWVYSKGCNAEFQVAKVYGKEIIG